MMVLYNSAPVMKLFVWESANCKWKFFFNPQLLHVLFCLWSHPSAYLLGRVKMYTMYIQVCPSYTSKELSFFSLVKDFKKRANMSYVSPVLKPFYYIISQKYMLDFLKSANNVCFVSTYKNKTECKYWYFHSISL